MEMNLQTPTARHQSNYSGDTKLVYVQECGTQPLDKDEDFYGDCTMCIDEDGLLLFNYYFTTPSLDRDEPPDELSIMCYVKTSSPETAKRVAIMVLDNIENMTKAKWIEFGFTREAV